MRRRVGVEENDWCSGDGMFLGEAQGPTQGGAANLPETDVLINTRRLRNFTKTPTSGDRETN